ncbi:MAG TPA: TonB-dependent receptor [Gemmatales bacterium]|nr:TonB-dependent receptor [Gemmatales bacterium]HMP60671.1 TonB-dependent receptor [Gemmatales bacterium]
MAHQGRGTWPRKSRWLGALILTGGMGTWAWASEPATPAPAAPPTPASLRIVDPNVQRVQVEPQQPPELAAPTQRTVAGGAGTGLGDISGFGPASATPTPTERQAANVGPSASTTSGAESVVRASSDVGDLLNKSDRSVGVEVQRRNQLVTDPRIRGFHIGQIFSQADGAFYFPARQDLDTIVSKIDSGLIRDVVVLRGPYSVRYGPGFAFIDIETTDTPRYDCFEAHGVTTFGYRSNGQQLRGRQTVFGGGQDYGFRMTYLFNNGNNYLDGNGNEVPSSFKSQFVDYAVGFDLTPNSKIEFNGLYVNQNDVLLPGMFLDIDRLITQAYSVRFTAVDQEYYDQKVVDIWYNYTWLRGNAQRPSKRQQIPELDNPFLNLISFTDSGTMSAGIRDMVSWGKASDAQFTLGWDLRFLSHELNEYDRFGRVPQPTDVDQFGFPLFFTPEEYNAALNSYLTNFNNFPVPRSQQVNPGLFADGRLPINDALVVKGGARIDFVNADITAATVGRSDLSISSESFLNTNQYDREFLLWSGYVSAEYQLFQGTTATIAFGAAQRPPTLTEMYAVQPFMAVVQNGLNFVTGDPALRPEKLIQLDVGLRAEYDGFRFGVNGFYNWVRDYITFDAESTLVGFAITDPLAPLGLRFVNTDRATLVGFEAYTEFDVLEWLTPFAAASYTQGTDLTRGDRTANAVGQLIGAGDTEPLPGIAPFESRVGVRIHDTGPNPAWGVEGSARLVAKQTRVAASLNERETPGFTTYDLRVFWLPQPYLTLSAGVENLTDVFYREHLDLRTGGGFFQPGRNFYLTAELRY